jgi:peptidyl-prolyl cis-trans isomerase D
MLRSFRAKTTSIFFWVIVILLIIGLAGFGITTGGFRTPNVAQVGDREISAEEFARTYDQELRAIGAQLGRPLTAAEGRQFGVDGFVLSRLVNDAALDHEAGRLGLSAGDEFVSRQIMGTPAFRGLDGTFDREAYRFALDRAGLSIREFEEQVRREAAREIVAASIQAPAAVPAVAGRTILDFLGERRIVEWLRLDATRLETPLPEPSEEDLRAFHGEHPERYTRGEVRRVTYALLDPEAVAEGIEIDQERLRAAYEDQRGRFETPERRYLDRIGFATMDEAAAARARLDAGEIGFDALAAERELAPADIDLGLIAAADLAPEARAAVFEADGPGIVGPVQTPLGPSLYRINGVVAARSVPFEEARDGLATELARLEARDAVLSRARELEDLIAAGASVEEIADETPATLGTIELGAETGHPLEGDAAFRAAAATARLGMETDPVELDDGAVATLRLEEVVPPTLLPLDEVRERVAADWRDAEAAARLTAEAEGLVAEIAGGTALGEIAERLGTPLERDGPFTRGETIPGLPDEIVAEIFALEPEGALAFPLPDGAVLARLETVEPFDPADGENAVLFDSVDAELRRQMGDDLLALYTLALQAEAGVSVNQSVLEGTLAQFP